MKPLFRYRHLIQVGALILYNANYLFSYKYCPVPGLNCYACPLAVGACPLGSLQHFMVIRRFPFFLMGFFLLIGSTVGRMVCGWVCPVGWLQEMIYKVKVKKVRISSGPFRYLKYVVLVLLVLIIPYWARDPWFSKLCFVGTIQAGIPLALSDAGIRAMIGGFFYFKLGLTAVTVASFLWIKRPFCRFLCPLGAIYSLFNGVSYLRLEVGEGCSACNRCQTVCPVDIRVYENPNSPECIRCLECTVCAHVSLQKGGQKAADHEGLTPVES